MNYAKHQSGRGEHVNNEAGKLINDRINKLQYLYVQSTKYMKYIQSICTDSSNDICVLI